MAASWAITPEKVNQAVEQIITISQPKKLILWWNRTIQEGERLGARPDLSRTHFEVGKRLLEPQSKHRQLNGIDARDYLERAEKLFQEMELEWDLEQLERVRTGR